MQEMLVQPAAILTAAILDRTHPGQELNNAVIASAFIQAYQSLELAQEELGKEHSKRAVQSFQALG